MTRRIIKYLFEVVVDAVSWDRGDWWVGQIDCVGSCMVSARGLHDQMLHSCLAVDYCAVSSLAILCTAQILTEHRSVTYKGPRVGRCLEFLAPGLKQVTTSSPLKTAEPAPALGRCTCRHAKLQPDVMPLDIDTMYAIGSVPSVRDVTAYASRSEDGADHPRSTGGSRPRRRDL